ncbi:serine hydrolase domain-containing protein [Mucilaginibacter sp.]|uniref:serine hydrolase domain-containing protein n=1 Tax=Mucilaginibacter sp. TaxID=1882438 RepID=UPI003267EB52
MKKSNFVVLFIAGVFSTSVCLAQIKTAPQQFKYQADLKKEGTSNRKIAGIDSLLQSFVDQNKVSSVVGFVAKGGNVVYKKAFGMKDVENKVPASADDYYILFSQTKAIVTVAFMTLVEKGLVKIDDPVSKYFPQIPDRVAIAVRSDGTYETRPVARPMTFIDLMCHSSGLNAGIVASNRRTERLRADSIRKANGDTAKSITPGQRSGGTGNWKYLKDAMEDLAKYPLGFDPGSEYSYHISSNMLAYMVEIISGQPLRQYVRESVLEPLGMKNTDWYYEPAALPRFVKAYNAVNGKLEPASNMFSEGAISKNRTYAEGGLGLNGPIEDYAKFCQMLLNRGEFNGRRILKPETIDLMTKVNRLPEVNAGGKNFRFGLGFELYNQNRKTIPEVSNTAYAWGGAYGTQYVIDPENNMIVLFYINMPKHDDVLYPSFLSKAYQLFGK